tara:strand:- start:3818 stop:4090 length:273 start_codon:yes stop_codon:yes gene_type:complete
MVSEKERLRRAVAERGFWKEMEERGIPRGEVFFIDEHYDRLNEIGRGLITTEDREQQERRVRQYQADIHRKEIEGWRAVQRELDNEEERP